MRFSVAVSALPHATDRCRIELPIGQTNQIRKASPMTDQFDKRVVRRRRHGPHIIAFGLAKESTEMSGIAGVRDLSHDVRLVLRRFRKDQQSD